MNIKEYNKVKDMDYNEYCDYLQDKYGIGLANYMTKSFNPNPKCKRTKEGLYAHHKAEDKMIMLSNKEIAMYCPYEWQEKENIVYCDLLEHLLLHVLICLYPSPEKMEDFEVGVGGIIDFMVPELNDLYSGWRSNMLWQQRCHNKVISDKKVYLEILRKFVKNYCKRLERLEEDFLPLLLTSNADYFGSWSKNNNAELYKEIIETVLKD